MSHTENLNLPLIQERQAHKHIALNESLVLLDILTQLAVVSATETQPPQDPAAGAVYIIAADALGDWVGGDHKLAFYHNGAWQMIAPREGFSAWNKATSQRLTFYNSLWQ